ncbi:cbb3-type cytochrome oxidase assembly protein CcoS [Aquicoccus sp.]|uniref:cbb3-type cytochrome oxidase assembly protein CcoS n=1 Tax=Aquicoccus sp. TaxID=2055851 RepID=UPI003568A0A9
MSSLSILIPLSLGMGFVGLCAFLWALRANQFDDPEGNAWRVITLDGQSDADDPRDKGGDRDDHKASDAVNHDPDGR